MNFLNFPYIRSAGKKKADEEIFIADGDSIIRFRIVTDTRLLEYTFAAEGRSEPRVKRLIRLSFREIVG